MKERYQQELAKRAHYTLPFVDGSTVSGIVRKILGRHHGGLVRRIEAFAPIRLEEGIGTEILIKEKRSRR